jgi:hypothetical protein
MNLATMKAISSVCNVAIGSHDTAVTVNRGGDHPLSPATLEIFVSRMRDISCGAFNESALTVSAGCSNNGWPPVNRPRQHLVSDFLIAAHALSQAHRLAAVDRGYLRVWFPQLILLQPPGQ